MATVHSAGIRDTHRLTAEILTETFTDTVATHRTVISDTEIVIDRPILDIPTSVHTVHITVVEFRSALASRSLT